MRLLTFMKAGEYALGIKLDHGIIDIEAALAVEPDNRVPVSVTHILEGGDRAVASLENYLEKLDNKSDSSYMLNEEEIVWGPSVTHPNKIICIGLNYRKHADETGAAYPEYPILFNKFNNALTGHQSDIAVPNVTKKLDYEVELGIVIGKQGKYISKDNALDHVFGYCTANDLSARDLQRRTPQWLLGKSCDGFCPIGPFLVTSDEVADPNHLKLQTTVNGEIRQNSTTADMIFGCDEIISYISQHMTLVPGDIILTGTPEGVIMGYPEAKQNYLNPGDKVTVEVEGLGALSNSFIKEES
ncbi:5-carboxymethyl-2-hydroxymuconate isomerase [Salipaludibacillus neizhouensis]|uniref:5-carboxymethyl-2-hydroxymuconate isomerase n=1 Tax=Salipaludibacillus neizhouensis TaxID=885475 RepID=A0A3A9K7Z3_9BACI|nr:fumarylacetoacetate hydrolase family protein [Salipaludibacillus neizhouensis]RKL66652.1 5-carboxymethyl-2-hydroxymuconate isomerase [Salipaludibacillus neizhouensis]